MCAARVKKLCRLDDDVKTMSKDAVFMIGKATVSSAVRVLALLLYGPFLAVGRITACRFFRRRYVH